jgi:hypothetical protein
LARGSFLFFPFGLTVSDVKQIQHVDDSILIISYKSPIAKFNESDSISQRLSRIPRKRTVIARFYREHWMKLRRLSMNVMHGTTMSKSIDVESPRPRRIWHGQSWRNDLYSNLAPRLMLDWRMRQEKSSILAT